MANLTSVKIKDSFQSVLTTSVTTSDPTTGILQNGKGTAMTEITVPIVKATTGVLFGADTAAANTLDDYEEGFAALTLTPGGSGTFTVDPIRAQITYTKIGRTVYLQGGINIGAVGTPVGTTIAITGLPFARADFSSPAIYAGYTGRAGIWIDASTSFARSLVPVELSDAGFLIWIDASTVEAGDRFYLDLSYTTTA